MSTDEYVPSEDDVKIAWADRRLFLDSLSDGNPSPDAVYDAEFDRFLARVRRDAAKEVSALPQRFRAPEALARFIIENEWALDSEINPSGRADWHETLNRVYDAWDGDTPEDIVSTIAAAIRLDRDFRTPHQNEVARAALTDMAESSLRTAELAATRGDKEWESDARFVAREAIEHRDAHYPEETGR